MSKHSRRKENGHKPQVAVPTRRTTEQLIETPILGRPNGPYFANDLRKGSSPPEWIFMVTRIDPPLP